jgi:mono/diheme cytochrome c family protein
MNQIDAQDVGLRWSGGAALGGLLLVGVLAIGLSCQRSRPPDVAKPNGSKTQKPTGDTAPSVTDTDTTAADNKGRDLYLQHCAACHGEQGDGQGIAAAYLFPKPRDFRLGKFRLVSTANRVPSADDLNAVLVRGMPGSAMPPWSHLSDGDRKLLVDEVVRLARDGAREQYVAILKEEEGLTDEEIQEEEVQQQIAGYVERRATPGAASEVPEIPPATDEAIARGKDIYIQQSCHSCHGLEGKGDGQQAMVDDEGFATQPRDFTLGIFKGGHDPASLYRRTAYGMPGTPMPSSQQLTPEQIVDLVHFVRSLSTEEARQRAILRREQIVAARVETIPAAVHASEWNGVAPVELPMAPLWWRNDADPNMQVQAVHDGATLALRLSWKDDTSDQNVARSESFKDAVAVELYRGEVEPFIGMGDPKSPVDVWYWDADRQGTPLAVEDVYPDAVVDIYPFSEDVVETAESDRPGARTIEQPDISLPARAVGNPIVPEDGESGGSSLTGGGPGSVTFRIPTSALVEARGEWQDGRWAVVMTRPLAVDPNGGVSLAPGARASMALAVWDGSQRDRDGKKLVTIWQDLLLSE